MPELTTDVRYIKGIGDQRARALNKLGIKTLKDLVTYFPRAYEDRRKISEIAQTNPDETVCIRCMVVTSPRHSMIRKGLELVKFRAVDDSGSVSITYFNQSYIKNQIKEGDIYFFYGRITGNGSKREMTNPLFEREDKAGIITGRIVPIYRLTAGVTQKLLINCISAGIEACVGQMPNPLPERIREEYNLAQTEFAYRNIHFPADEGCLELARQRLIFEELFVLAAALGRLRNSREDVCGIKMQEFEGSEFFSKLPFSPTNAQKNAIRQIYGDMCSGRAMNRLVQGDVGSGKTLVAAAAALLCIKNGRQAAFMAPTEILAEQHYKTFCDFLQVHGVRVSLLTGSMTAKKKKEVKNALASGDIDLVIGTHALIAENSLFSDLALVITDEQHRFGVSQRASLNAKADNTPHVLVMSATPIPRTLALIIYGDLDVSIIDELPPGRQKVDTFLVDESYRTRLNNFVRTQVNQGRQVFIICPAVEENDEQQGLKSVTEHTKYLEDALDGLHIGCLYGKMKAKEKEFIMRKFSDGELDVLVSTTVVEVGVDVPNASLILIENADRFGLSQLHQLRGRVGRGKHKSYCVLVSENKQDDTVRRLRALCSTNDGFEISEEDLKLRGPGDFFGSRQHGLPEMRIADLCTDMSTLLQAQKAAQKLLSEDPELKSMNNRRLLKQIEQLFNENISTLN